LIVQTSSSEGQILELHTNGKKPIPNIFGDPLWSPNGSRFAYAIRPSSEQPSSSGLWVGEIAGKRTQVFQGWVLSLAWLNENEILILEGRPNYQGILRRIEIDGQSEIVLSDVPIVRREHEPAVSPTRFDVHPDGRRIVIETLEFLEADIGMIENLR
jgi:hypothetical protein